MDRSNTYLYFSDCGKMDYRNELLENYSFSKEDQLIPKIEPIDVNLIKKEKIEEEEFFVVPGIVESSKVDINSVKKEVFGKDKIDNCSSSNV